MPASSLSARIVPVLFALVLSAAGGGIATFAGMPGGWLMGGAVAVTLAAMAGLAVEFPNWLRDVAFVLIGMSMGASVDPNSLQLLANWPVSIAALLIETVVIIWLTGWMLVRLFKLDAGTAYLSSFPGHLSLILGIAASGVGNARQILVIQVFRVLVLIICVPIGALLLPGEHLPAPASRDWLTVWELLAIGAGCVVVGLVFRRLRVPASFVLGSMAAATVAKLAGLYTADLPGPLMTITFILTGALIGSRFVGVTRAELFGAVRGGLVATGLMVCIVTATSYAVSKLVDLPFGQVWLGLAPGALEGMGALGIALGYDTAFIAGHHVIRLLALAFAIPAAVVWIRRREAAIITQ